MLTDDEVRGLILALVGGQGSVSEAQIDQVLEWADNTRIDNALVDLAVAGKITVRIDGKERPKAEPRLVFSRKAKADGR